MQRRTGLALFSTGRLLLATVPSKATVDPVANASQAETQSSRTYKQNSSRPGAGPFPESPANETRRIRTRPRTRDYTRLQRQLMEAASWQSETAAVGNYVEESLYDPNAFLDLDDRDIDLECLPDSIEWYNPFTKATDKIDFSVLHMDEEDTSREAKALRWEEQNVPLRDTDLPIALRNPETREETLKAAFGPNARPRDMMKIWNMKEPTVMDIDPWIVEEYNKLPVVKGKKMNVFQLICHPRTLRAAVEYCKIMYPSDVQGPITSEMLEELSELVLSGKYKPPTVVPDPPNPYRMEED